MDAVAHTGAVDGRALAAERCKLPSAAGSDLGDEQREVVRMAAG